MMDNQLKYAIACRTEWFWDLWREHRPAGEWLEIRDEDELLAEDLNAFKPRYVFFPHWSSIVPNEIVSQFECVCFHAAPVPFGRGGSPVQNMIVRGHDETELVALRMTEELDAGPVYMRRTVSLLGGGDEIYLRLADNIIDLMRCIIKDEPKPQEQEGSATVFKRRKPQQSRLSEDMTLREVFDFIRMLDAEGYPRAFVEYGDMRLEFSRAALRRGRIVADVVIKPSDSSSA